MRRFLFVTVLIVAESISLFSTVLCRRIKFQESGEKDFEEEYLWNLFGAISRAKENLPFNGRKHDGNSNALRYIYKALSKSVDVDDFKNWLRHDDGGYKGKNALRTSKDELEGLVEVELLNALAKKSAAVLDKPYVQKKGKNDFLVIRSDLSDPFVTIVPNDIYYNVEKKCVNWLDDCNLKGLRDRMLQKVHGPYK